MATAWVALANLTLGSTSTSVTFSSISSAYRDLVLVVQTKASSTSITPAVRFNADSTANQSVMGLGYATSYNYTSENVQWVGGTVDADATTWVSYQINIFDWAATDKHKITFGTVIGGSVSPSSTITRWPSNTAISTIQFFPLYGTSFAVGSSFALYGIKA